MYEPATWRTLALLATVALLTTLSGSADSAWADQPQAHPEHNDYREDARYLLLNGQRPESTKTYRMTELLSQRRKKLRTKAFLLSGVPGYGALLLHVVEGVAYRLDPASLIALPSGRLALPAPPRAPASGQDQARSQELDLSLCAAAPEPGCAHHRRCAPSGTASPGVA